MSVRSRLLDEDYADGTRPGLGIYAWQQPRLDLHGEVIERLREARRPDAPGCSGRRPSPAAAGTIVHGRVDHPIPQRREGAGAEPVVSYLDSSRAVLRHRIPEHVAWADVLGAARDEVARTIAAEGFFTITCLTAIITCRGPKRT